MSRVDSGYGHIVTERVPSDANRHRWHLLRYLRSCRYPASVVELSEYVAPRVGTDPAVIEATIERRDLPVLADCGAIEYDPDSRLACLPDDGRSFADCVRSAFAVGALSHLKPPRLESIPDEGPDAFEAEMAPSTPNGPSGL